MNGDGTGSLTIYGGEHFDDESFALTHTRAGLVSMANQGPNTNGCQFFITCAATSWLDGKHVVFGRVVDQESMLVVRKIESVPVNEHSRPKLEVRVTKCGEL